MNFMKRVHLVSISIFAALPIVTANIALASPSECLTFEEDAIKQYALDNWDNNEDGCVSEKEAASVRTIPTFAFGKKDIKTLDDLKQFPNLETIEESAFRACKNLSVINLSQIKTIGDNAFMDTAASEIKLPNVREIGIEAFADTHPTPSKKKITYRFPKLQKLGTGAFARITPKGDAEVTYVIPVTSKEAFKNNKFITNLEFTGSDIHISAFEKSSITKVILNRSVAIEKNAFANSNLISIEGTQPPTIGVNSSLPGSAPQASSPVIKQLGDGAFKGSKLNKLEVFIDMDAFDPNEKCRFKNGAVCPGSEIFDGVTLDTLYIDAFEYLHRINNSRKIVPNKEYGAGIFDDADTEDIKLKIFPSEMKKHIDKLWNGDFMKKEWKSIKYIN